MPFYHFECDSCGEYYVVEGSMANPPQPFECTAAVSETRRFDDGLDYKPCGAIVNRIFGARIDVFRPYVDEHSSGIPTTIETKRQREKFCAENGVTYDTGRYVRRPIRRTAASQLDADEVLKVLHEKGPQKHELHTGKLEPNTRIIETDGQGS